VAALPSGFIFLKVFYFRISERKYKTANRREKVKYKDKPSPLLF
jgi:hypothetical protein